MDLTKFVKKDVLKIMSIVLIVCSCDELYMFMKYRDSTIEDLGATLFFTGLCIYLGFGKGGEKN